MRKLSRLLRRLLFLTTLEREILMTLFQRIETIESALIQAQTDIAALKNENGPDQSAAIAAVDAKVDALAALVGTPTVV